MIESLFLAKDKGEDWREEEERGREWGRGGRERETWRETQRERDGSGREHVQISIKLVGREVSTVWRLPVFSNTVRIR